VALGAPSKQKLREIVGIVLVHNEDRFVRQAVRNAWDFCDRIFLFDHRSEDGTRDLLRGISEASNGKAPFHEIAHPRESHDVLKPLVGTATWVFGVDGDELYDPARLRAFRPRLLAGEFDAHWMVLGNVLHCDRVDAGDSHASGYLAPPSRSITKLYNFSAIESWDGDTPERLHGGAPVFRKGFDELSKRRLEEEYSWEDSPLRCLHACFVPRSSRDSRSSTRENIMETFRGGWTNRIKRLARRLARNPETSDWKRDRYARGDKVTVPADPFFA